MNRKIIKLENISVELTQDAILIWKNHDKNYQHGSYYQINKKTDEIKLVFDTTSGITEFDIPKELQIKE